MKSKSDDGNLMVIDSEPLDPIYLSVVKIQSFFQDMVLFNATGFFYLQDNYLYLVTARHVVINEATQHRPDRLQCSLHSDAGDLLQRADLSIPLYLDGVPQWHERSDAYDVVAVSINRPDVLRDHAVVPFYSSDILQMDQAMPLGQEVVILGFPLGFHDTFHNLPIARGATIASSFSHPFKGEPYFLTDSRMHRGMSGSPVIVRSSKQQDVHESHKGWSLLGIHSSSVDVSDRDPNQDERLGLNTAWYASLIPQMLPRRHDSDLV